MTSYTFNDYFFFTIKHHDKKINSDIFITQVYKCIPNEYGVEEENFIGEIDNITSAQIAEMEDTEIINLIKNL